MSAQEKPPTGTVTESPDREPKRRPYKSPNLKSLGSVRNLTFGSGPLQPDGSGAPTGNF